VLRRLSGKAQKRRNIKIFLRFCNAVRQDGSTLKILSYFVLVPKCSEKYQGDWFGTDLWKYFFVPIINRLDNATSKENRTTQSKFFCIECGRTQNADINASLNILREGSVKEEGIQ